jgi:hypothetical protein
VGQRISISKLITLLALQIVICVQLFVAPAQAKKVPPKAPAPPVEKSEFTKPMTFSVFRLSGLWCDPNCPHWIAADGDITDETPAKLERLLANPNYRKFPILVNSAGGRIYAAMKMGRLIRKYKMNIGVSQSVGIGCGLRTTCITLGTKNDKINVGYLITSQSYCNSACTIFLLGGVVRIGGNDIYIGLHQPHDNSPRWIDHYWDTWRMINGKKHIISHRFVKRTFLKPNNTVGVTPQLKKIYVSYLKQMGGSPQIIDEMEKASPNQMNFIPANTSRRKELGLVTDGSLDVTALVNADHCKLIGEKFTSKCGPKIPSGVSPTIEEGNSEKCYILGGCAKAKPVATNVAATPLEKCYILSGCAEEKPLPVEKPKCYVLSGCN